MASEALMYCALKKTPSHEKYEEIAMRAVSKYDWETWRNLAIMLLDDVFQEGSVNNK